MKLSNIKGITLVALVVTIIILLILAGITMSELTRENGLIAKVNQAKEAQIKAEMKETLILAINELQLEKEGKATLEDIIQEWITTAITEYTCSLSDNTQNNEKQILMEKDKINATFLIDENLNITLKDTKSGIKFTYEKGIVNNGVITISITIISETNIAKVELPDGDTVKGNKQIIGIDFDAIIGEEYIFNIILENGEEQEEKIRIEPTFLTTPVTSIEEAQSDYMLAKTVNSKIEDKYGNKITIPAGFKIKVSADTNYTNNIPTADKGIVIIDSNGNEFVWIPVPELIELEDGTKEGRIYANQERTEYKDVKLNRYTFAEITGNPTAQKGVEIEGKDGSKFQELQESTYGNIPAKSITNFKQSVANNNGYYIGRYEARTTISEENKNILTEKGTDRVYNNVTQNQAAEISQNMYDNTKPFTSDLMNSYAWDTATLFLQKFGNSVTPYSLQTSVNTGSLATTGTNNITTKDVQCNVYDMASNIYEWTTEASKSSSSPCVSRGHAYIGNGNFTSVRNGLSISYGYEYSGFRPILYLTF